MKEIHYAGFWVRLGASLIDSLLMIAVLLCLLTLFFGTSYWSGVPRASEPVEIILNYFVPFVVVVVFWIYKSATPGKLILGLSIVDATTGGKPSTRQLVGRYLGYYVSSFALLLGFFWVIFDARKQGWHDKLANTVVVREN